MTTTQQRNEAKLSSHDRMLATYNKYKGKVIDTDKYIGVVSGFHFKWDDCDRETLIIAIIKEKSIRTGMRYCLNGDVHMTHSGNEFGYDFLAASDFCLWFNEMNKLKSL